MVNMELASLQLILHSGNARSLAFEAIASMKKQDVTGSESSMKEAHEELLIAQKEHAQLLRKMATEEDKRVDLLLIHAEDHVASSQVIVELINEMVQIYERFGEKQ